MGFSLLQLIHDGMEDDADDLFVTESLPPTVTFAPASAETGSFRSPGLPREDEVVFSLLDQLVTIQQHLNEVNRVKRVLETERAKLENGLLAEAQARGLTQLADRIGTVRAIVQSSVGFPTKADNPNGYARLDRTLRASPAWQHVSRFDRFALVRVWEDRQKDPGGVRALVQPFVETRQRIKLVGGEVPC
jgi:hypothetical protein